MCGKQEYRKLYTVGGKDIVECKGCGLVRTSDFEEPDYGQYHREFDYAEFEKHFRNIYEKRFAISGCFSEKTGRVLEIGASRGIMLDIFRERGWETWGVEPSAKSANEARRRGHKILTKIFEEAELPNNYFEVVVLNHTLEHMENPVEVMKKVRMVLKNKGVVLVDVPNYGALSRAVLGKRWPYFLPEEHRWHFDKNSLGKVFEKAGLRVVHWESRSGLFEYRYPTRELWQSLMGRKKRFFKNILGLAGATAATYINRGSSFSMVGRK